VHDNLAGPVEARPPAPLASVVAHSPAPLASVVAIGAGPEAPSEDPNGNPSRPFPGHFGETVEVQQWGKVL